MRRDYDFWIFIVTNRNHSVRYIGVTNSPSRRSWNHREGTGACFPARYHCQKLIYYERYSRRHCARITIEKMVTREEDRTHQSDEPTLAGSRRRCFTGQISLEISRLRLRLRSK